MKNKKSMRGGRNQDKETRKPTEVIILGDDIKTKMGEAFVKCGLACIEGRKFTRKALYFSLFRIPCRSAVHIVAGPNSKQWSFSLGPKTVVFLAGSDNRFLSL